MKSSILLPALCCLLASFTNAQQRALGEWDVAIPGRLNDGTRSEPPPKPAPLGFSVLHSRTKRMWVNEAPEMPDLPPITGTINLTVQLVEDPKLPAPPPPPPVLAPNDPAAFARRKELAAKYRPFNLVFLSATVYDHRRTLLRIYPSGKFDQKVEAWSNIDFNHFSGFSTYQVRDGIDGTVYNYGLLMGIGNTNTRRWAELAAARGIESKGPGFPDIPDLPDLANGGPAFSLVKGEKDSPAMATLEQLHDLYRKEGPRMESAYHARGKARAERKAHLLANPPVPEDVTIRVWRRTPNNSKREGTR